MQKMIKIFLNYLIELDNIIVVGVSWFSKNGHQDLQSESLF